MSKPTKIDADTWQHGGFTISRCTHSRTFLATRPDGTKTYVRNRLRDVVTDIDCWHWKQWDDSERATAAAAREAQKAPQADPDAVENVTLTVSLNQARTILAALSRRQDELCQAVSAPGCDELLAGVKSAYQIVDQQTFHPVNS